MTRQKTFKRRVRTRMAKTGERYAAARRTLIAAHEESAASEKATGRSKDEWFALLDDWGAAERTHTEIASWLSEQADVSGWWAQMLTVAYEQARGRRLPHERPDGFRITASKTIAVPVAALYKAVIDDRHRARWLPHVPLRLRTASAPRSARYDWEDGPGRVNFGFTAKSDTTSTIALSHERIADPETAEKMKRWWRERLSDLKIQLEQTPRK